MTLEEAKGLKVGDRLRYKEHTIIWEVRRVEDRGVVIGSSMLSTPHLHLVEYTWLKDNPNYTKVE